MQRILGIVGALLLVASVFLPLLVGPAIEGMLGNEPNQSLSSRPMSGVYPQSWFVTGRGEQIIFIMLVVACLFGALLGNQRVLRIGAVTVALGIFFGIFLTSNRVRRIQYDYVRQAEYKFEMDSHEARMNAGRIASGLPPIVRTQRASQPIDPNYPSSTPSYGVLVMMAGLFCLQFAAWSGLGSREVRGRAMPLGIVIPAGLAIFAGLLGAGLLTKKYRGPEPKVVEPINPAVVSPPSSAQPPTAAPVVRRRSRFLTPAP